MVHTSQFYIQIERETKEYLELKFNEDITLIGQIINKEIKNKFEGVTINIKNNNKFINSMYIIIDFIKLMKKSDIKEDDFKNIDYKIDQILYNIFAQEVKNINLVMTRIDYRKDIVIKNKREREMYINLYKKCRNKFNFKVKYSKYDSTVYFNNKSMQICIYDKEIERIKKDQVVKEYEKDILRIEVRLSNRHLSMKKRLFGIGKTLENYFKDEMKSLYFDKHLKEIMYRGAYRKIYKVDEILEKAEIREKDKIEIREFLIDVSKNGVTGALEKRLADGKVKYSKYTYKRYVKILNELDINPILIPKNSKISDTLQNLFVV